MMLPIFAWRNLWRNKSRTIITMASVFFAVLMAVLTTSLQAGVFDNLVKNVVSFYTGYAQVHGKGYQENQSLENAMTSSDSLYAIIRHHPNVASVSPRFESFALASSGEKTKGCLIVGVDPVLENQMTHLKDKVRKGNYLGPDGTGLLLAEGLAKRLSINIGDTIVLLGQSYYGGTAAGKYPVTGFLRFGSPELNDNMVYMSLQQSQTLFDAPEILTTLVLSFHNINLLDGTIAGLRKSLSDDYEVISWEEIMPEIKEHMKTDTVGGYIISGILYLVIAFGIFSTLLMLMAERRKEFGMLVAIGMKRSRIALMLLMESLMTTFSGCLLGILCSIPLTWYLSIHPIRMGGKMGEVYEKFGFEAILPTAVHAWIYISQGIIVLCVALVLSLYPVFRALRLDPVAAMRN